MLDYCIEMAKSVPFEKNRVRVYAVITNKSGIVISEGSNSYVKTHPYQKHCGVRVGLFDKEYLHAECRAIIRSRGKGENLYIARVDSKGKPMAAKPCPICQLAIEDHGKIKNVYWSE